VAGQPHDATGRVCQLQTHCEGIPFTKTSVAFRVQKREGNLLVGYIACGKCRNAFFDRGEED